MSVGQRQIVRVTAASDLIQPYAQVGIGRMAP